MGQKYHRKRRTRKRSSHNKERKQRKQRKQRGGNCQNSTTEGECRECVDEWYLEFGENLRNQYKQRISEITKAKLVEINDETDVEIKAEKIKKLAAELEKLKKKFNVRLARLRLKDFDEEYRARLKYCESLPSRQKKSSK